MKRGLIVIKTVSIVEGSFSIRKVLEPLINNCHSFHYCSHSLFQKSNIWSDLSDPERTAGMTRVGVRSWSLGEGNIPLSGFRVGEILWGGRNLFGREIALALQFNFGNMGSTATHQFQLWHRESLELICKATTMTLIRRHGERRVGKCRKSWPHQVGWTRWRSMCRT